MDIDRITRWGIMLSASSYKRKFPRPLRTGEQQALFELMELSRANQKLVNLPPRDTPVSSSDLRPCKIRFFQSMLTKLVEKGIIFRVNIGYKGNKNLPRYRYFVDWEDLLTPEAISLLSLPTTGSINSLESMKALENAKEA